LSLYKTTMAPKTTAKSYLEMISQAIVDMKARNGASRAALKKYLLSNYKDINYEAFDRSLRTALKRGTESGALVQNKQSFKLSPDSKKAVKVVKPKKSASSSASGPSLTSSSPAPPAPAKKKVPATKKKAPTTKKKSPAKKKSVPKKKTTKITGGGSTSSVKKTKKKITSKKLGKPKSQIRKSRTK